MAWPEYAAYGRHHLPDGGMRLHGRQMGDLDGSGLADPSEVVAGDIDDHHMLGVILSRRLQVRAQFCVLVGGGATRSRALDRPRLGNTIRVEPHEALRACAGDLDVTEAQ